jgi:hypothetical protein
MNIYNGITWCYRLIFSLIAVLLAINIFRHDSLTKKVLGVIVLLPLLLRLFNIK